MKKTNIKNIILSVLIVFLVIAFISLVEQSLANGSSSTVDQSVRAENGSIKVTEKMASDPSVSTANANERVNVKNLTELKTALGNDNVRVITVTQAISITNAQELDGDPHNIRPKIVKVPNTGLNEACQILPNASNFNVFSINTTATVTIKNMIIQGGGKSAIDVDNAYLKLDNVAVALGCAGINERGGGIDGLHTNIYMVDSIVARNAAHSGGGINLGMLSDTGKGRLIADRCSFSYNRSLDNSGGGGALQLYWNGNDAYCNNCSFVNNTSSELGGAVNVCAGPSFHAINTTFAGNSTTRAYKPETTTDHESMYGGAIGASRLNSSNLADINVANCLFCNNYSSAYENQSGSVHENVVESDIGNYHSSTGFHVNINMIGCSYRAIGNLQSSPASYQTINITDCKKISNTENIFYKNIITSMKYGNSPEKDTKPYSRPLVARTLDGTYDLYPPIFTNSEICSVNRQDGQCYATYFNFDSSDGTNPVGMAYKLKSGTGRTKLGSAADTSIQVSKTFEGNDRNTDVSITTKYFPGCAGLPNPDHFYTVKLLQYPGGTATGASAEGDLVPSGAKVSLEAYPNSGYEFAGWYNVTTGEMISTNPHPLFYDFNITSDITICPLFTKDGQIPLLVLTSLDDKADNHNSVTASNGTNTVTLKKEQVLSSATFTAYTGSIKNNDTTTYKISIDGSPIGANLTKSKPIGDFKRYTITYDAGTNGMSYKTAGTKTGTEVTTYLGYLANGPEKVIDGTNAEFWRWSTEAAWGKGEIPDFKNIHFDSKQTFYAQAYKYVGSEPTAKSFEYDGIEHTTADEGTNYTLSGDVKKTNAGSYKLKATPKDGYKWSKGKGGTLEIPWEIKPRSLSNIDASVREYTYNKQEQAVTNDDVIVRDGTIPIVKGSDWTVVDSPKRTDAGKETIKIKAVDGGNYSGEREITWIIKKATMTVSIAGTTKTTVYNKQEQDASGFTATAINDPQKVFDASEFSCAEGEDFISGKDAKTSYTKELKEDYFSFSNGDNVDLKYDSFSPVTLTITKAPLSVAVTGNTDSKIYNKQDQSVSGYTISTKEEWDPQKIFDDEDFEFIGTPDQQTAHGINCNTYTTNLDANLFNFIEKNNVDLKYNSFSPVTLIINKAKLAVNINGNSATKVYNGLEQSVSGFDILDASKSPIFDKDEFVYIGTPEQQTAKGINCGVYTTNLSQELFKFTNSANVDVEYNFSPITLTITIAHMDIDIIGDQSTITYDGKNHSYTQYKAESSHPLFNKNLVEYVESINTQAKDVGSYSAQFKPENFVYKDPGVDVKFSIVNDGLLTIDPAKLEIITESAQKTYDGTPLTAPGKINGLVNKETANLKTTGSQTEVGISDNTYKIDWNGTAKQTNYKIDKEQIGKLTVDSVISSLISSGDNILLLIAILGGIALTICLICLSFKLHKSFASK